MKIEKNETVTMRYRLSDRDVFYGGGVINGARGITLLEDVSQRLLSKVAGDSGICRGVHHIRLYEPLHAGDYLENKARIYDIQDNKIFIQSRIFKIAALPETPEFPSSIDILENPILCTEAMFIFTLHNKNTD